MKKYRDIKDQRYQPPEFRQCEGELVTVQGSWNAYLLGVYRAGDALVRTEGDIIYVPEGQWEIV